LRISSIIAALPCSRPVPEVALRVVGQDLGHRRPVALVHRAGESRQRSFDVTFIEQNS
jgi:hypothetical protein